MHTRITDERSNGRNTTVIPTVDDPKGILRGPRRTDTRGIDESFSTAAKVVNPEKTQEATDHTETVADFMR